MKHTRQRRWWLGACFIVVITWMTANKLFKVINTMFVTAEEDAMRESSKTDHH